MVMCWQSPVRRRERAGAALLPALHCLTCLNVNLNGKRVGENAIKCKCSLLETWATLDTKYFFPSHFYELFYVTSSVIYQRNDNHLEFLQKQNLTQVRSLVMKSSPGNDLSRRREQRVWWHDMRHETSVSAPWIPPRVPTLSCFHPSMLIQCAYNVSMFLAPILN